VFEPLTSATVPSTLKLPPVLVPPPPPMTRRSTGPIASGMTAWGVAVTAGIIDFALAGARLSTARCSIRCSAVTATANTTAGPINRSSLFFGDGFFISVSVEGERARQPKASIASRFIRSE